LFVLLFARPSEQGVVAGPACFGSCFSVCAMMGPGKFAALVGVVFDIMGCGAMCGPVCAMGLAIPGVCFSSSTTFLAPSFHQVTAAEITKGDVLMTLIDGELIQTPVINTITFNGPFDFVKIDLLNTYTNSTTTLTVTEEHGLLVFDNGEQKPIQAKHVVIGHEMVGVNHTKWKTQSIEKMKLPSMYSIQTATGTVVASGILTTTSCLHE